MGPPADGQDLEHRLATAIAWIGPCCRALPEVVEEPAWIGMRWRVRGKTFAHVLPVVDGAPASYARALGREGPAVVLTFRADGLELEALEAIGWPYFTVAWGRPVAGLEIDGRTDPAEVAELVTESYCLLAPAKLVALVDRPEA